MTVLSLNFLYTSTCFFLPCLNRDFTKSFIKMFIVSVFTFFAILWLIQVSIFSRWHSSIKLPFNYFQIFQWREISFHCLQRKPEKPKPSKIVYAYESSCCSTSFNSKTVGFTSFMVAVEHLLLDKFIASRVFYIAGLLGPNLQESGG